MRDRIIQLQESAEELGFGTIQQALDNGYHEVQDLVNGTFTLEKVEDLADRAYKEKAIEKEEILNKIDEVIAYLKEECDDDTCERPNFMIGNLREVEKFIEGEK